jgi:hypothetical protein
MINVLPHALTTISTTQVVPLGTVFEREFGYYVYVYNFGADTFAVGDAVSIATTSTRGYVSTTAATIADVTDGTTIRPIFAGVALSAIATTQYGWLFFKGRTTTHTLTTDGNVVALDLLTVADGAKVAVRDVTAADVTHLIIGRALATDSGTALTNYELTGRDTFSW